MVIFPIDRLRYTDRFPWVTLSLILVNALIYLLVIVPIFLGPAGELAFAEFLKRWGTVPKESSISTLFTCMFLHDINPVHVGFNMLMLWVFGNNVERRLGTLLYLGLYLLTGLAGTLLFIAFHARSSIPLVGASGAVFGVMGMYALFFPRNKIDVVYGLPLIWNGTIRVHCFILMSIYVFEQMIEWLLLSDKLPVAFEGHIGGFALGFLAALALRKVLHRQSFILKKEIDLSSDELMTPGSGTHASTRVLLGLGANQPVALLLEKNRPMGPEQLLDGLLLPPPQREPLLAQARASNGLFFRNLDAATGRRIAENVRRKHGVEMVVIPAGEFVELPPAAAVVDAWFGPDEIQLVMGEGAVRSLAYSDVRLISAGRVRLPEGQEFAILEMIAGRPAQRYILNERILRGELARQQGQDPVSLPGFAAAAVASRKVGFVTKTVLEWAGAGPESPRPPFSGLAELDTYTLWILNIATLMSRNPEGARQKPEARLQKPGL
jgi:membrane associated rhomboid family serine protease